MSYNFLSRKLIIEDKVTGLMAWQKKCYLTNLTAKHCDAHELFVKRSCGLPKDDQLKIFHVCNMVFVSSNVHTAGLNCFETLYLMEMKTKVHGLPAINAWFESLGLKSHQNIRQLMDSMLADCEYVRKHDGALYSRVLEARYRTREYKEWANKLLAV